MATIEMTEPSRMPGDNTRSGPERIPLNQASMNNKRSEEEYRDKVENTCYESILTCIGDFAGGLRTWLPCVCCICPYPYAQVEHSTIGIVEKFGKFQKTVEAGLYPINPCTENMRRVDLKTQILDLPRQLILTQDNITVNIDAVVFYRIFDPVRCTYRLEEPVISVREIGTSALRAITGEHTLQQLLEEREKISDQIEKFVEKELDRWGIYVEQVFIKDMIIDKDLQANLSAASKARRIGESKVISAKADVEAAKLLREAAEILASDAAMQIRYMETCQQLANTQTPKIMFLPIENREFEKKNQKAQQKR